jgi:hypothetical protein
MFSDFHCIVCFFKCWARVLQYSSTFIVETGGRVGVAGRRFLDTLISRLASEEAAEPAQDGAAGGAPARADAAKLAQARKRAALRAVAWSLVRQQGYMLAQIEGELNAPDRAVEGLVGEFGDDGSGVGSSSSLLPLDDD